MESLSRFLSNLVKINHGAIRATLFFVIIVLYIIVAYSSYGFDDEFYNIKIVEYYSPQEIISLAPELNPHHPNWSIYSNAILFYLTKDWSLVRVFYGLIFLVGMGLAYRILNLRDEMSKTIMFCLVFLNPSLLIVGTSLRWYSQLIPVLSILIAISLRKDTSKVSFWLLFILLSTLAFNLNYISILIIPALLVFLMHKMILVNQKLHMPLLSLLMLLIINIFSLRDFLYKAIHNGDSQTSGLIQSLFGYIEFQTIGLSSVPNSLAGIIGIIISLSLLGFFIIGFKKLDKKILFLYLINITLIIASGVGGKFRNFYSIIFLDSLVKTKLLSTFFNKTTYIFLLLLLLNFAFGSFNILTHSNTMKGSWNMPYADTIDTIDNLIKINNCEDSIAISHDIGIDWHLRKSSISTLYFYNDKDWIMQIKNLKPSCQFYISTSAGSLNRDYKLELDAYFKNNRDVIQKIFLKEDKAYKIKKLLVPNIQKYYVEIYLIKNN